jgi:hypothetical protein
MSFTTKEKIFYQLFAFILFCIGTFSVMSIIYAQGQDNRNLTDDYTKLLDENKALRLELENLKEEKFTANFKECSKICKRMY